MSKSEEPKLPEILKTAFNEEGFREDIEEKAKVAANRIKFGASLYLKDAARDEMAEIAKRHMAAITDRETMPLASQRDAQSVIIDNIQQEYDLCFVKGKVLEQWGAILAKNEVMDLVRVVGTEFAKTAVNVAFKHGLTIAKGAL